MIPIVSLVERPTLLAALAARGLVIAGDGAIVLARVESLPSLAALRTSYVGAALVAVAPIALHAMLLDGGADDAVTPDTYDDLLAARLAAVARRSDALLRVGDLAIDTLARRSTRAARPLPLLQREYALLLHLARRAGCTVPRAELREAVLGRAFDPGTNVLEVHVSRLRAKLDRGFATPMLLTEKGVGYRLVA